MNESLQYLTIVSGTHQITRTWFVCDSQAAFRRGSAINSLTFVQFAAFRTLGAPPSLSEEKHGA